MRLAGKLGRRGIVAAVRPGRLFFISDSTSQHRYLVDTGSAFSIMPWQSSTPLLGLVSPAPTAAAFHAGGNGSLLSPSAAFLASGSF
jgi:hypothetical protein